MELVKYCWGAVRNRCRTCDSSSLSLILNQTSPILDWNTGGHESSLSCAGLLVVPFLATFYAECSANASSGPRDVFKVYNNPAGSRWYRQHCQWRRSTCHEIEKSNNQAVSSQSRTGCWSRRVAWPLCCCMQDNDGDLGCRRPFWNCGALSRRWTCGGWSLQKNLVVEDEVRTKLDAE